MSFVQVSSSTFLTEGQTTEKMVKGIGISDDSLGFEIGLSIVRQLQ